MNEILVRGAGDPYEIAAVVALLGRGSTPPPSPGGVAAWRKTRRAAIAVRPHRKRNR